MTRCVSEGFLIKALLYPYYKQGLNFPFQKHSEAQGELHTVSAGKRHVRTPGQNCEFWSKLTVNVD